MNGVDGGVVFLFLKEGFYAFVGGVCEEVGGFVYDEVVFVLPENLYFFGESGGVFFDEDFDAVVFFNAVVFHPDSFAVYEYVFGI